MVLHEDKYHSKSEVGQEWNVTRNVEELSLKPWRQDVVLGIQVIVLILQATTSYQYAKEVNDVRETAGYDFKVCSKGPFWLIRRKIVIKVPNWHAIALAT